MEKVIAKRRIILWVWIILTISLLIIFSYFLSMILGLAAVFLTEDGRNFAARTASPYLLLPGQRLPPVNVGAFFLFLWVIYLLCFFAALLSRVDFANTLLQLRRVKDLFKNNLFSMPATASTLYITVALIQRIQEEMGLPVTAPTGGTPVNSFELFLALTYSPIIEELVFRLIPIGFFVAAYVIVKSVKHKPAYSAGGLSKLVLRGFLHPEKAKKDLGDDNVETAGVFRGISVWEWAMIATTAMLFGLAHYPFGTWGPGKLLPACISGFVLGVVYVVYGIQASILLHWYFNYYFNALNLAGTYFRTVPFTYVFFVVLNLFLGAAMYFLVFYRFLNRVFKRNIEF